MLRPIFLAGTTCFWLTMMSLLIRREFFQFTPLQASYEILPLHNLFLREEYQGTYMGEERIGFSFTILEDLETSPAKTYELRHQNYLSFLLLGRENEMLIRGKAKLDSQLYLKEFDLKISSKDYWNKMSGKVETDQISITIEGKDSRPVHKKIPLSGPVFYSESTDILWTPENLRIGKRGRLKLWNPLLLDIETLDFRVDHKEWITYEDKKAETFVIYLGRDGVESRTWVSLEGITLRKESPTGLLMKKEKGYEIFDAMRVKRDHPPDLPNLFSIPSNQILKNPEDLNYLKAEITMPEGIKTLERARPRLEDLDAIPWPFDTLSESMRPFLESTEFIQADDPEIKQKAREIAGGEKSALRASLKISKWVHGNVTPTPTVSVPSARQVLSVRKGDCNEYTALFTALARSLGIPTRMLAGLVYQNGRFFYHEWPEIYLGRWIGLDPTFDQFPADVAHLPLVEGGLQEQVALINRIGRMKVRILETK